MLEHIVLVAALVGWITTYVIYLGLSEEYELFQRRERNRDMRDADAAYIACDPVVRRLRAEIEMLRSERDEARAAANKWRSEWKEARQMRLMDLLEPAEAPKRIEARPPIYPAEWKE